MNCKLYNKSNSKHIKKLQTKQNLSLAVTVGAPQSSDGSAIPEYGEQRSKTLRARILVASSTNINLSTNMASEAISEHLILKIFMGEHAPRPP